MDGVLSDFQGRMFSLYGKPNPKYTNDQWVDFIQKNNFETLDMLLSAPVLLNFVNKTGINVEILSSSGGKEYHNEVVKQKTIWLKKHNIHYVTNIVPGGYKKASYAKSDTLLIDDTTAVVENFKKHGGNVILHDHRHVYDTIDKIKKIIYAEFNN